MSLTPSGCRLVGAVTGAVTAEQRQLSILATRVVYDHRVSASRRETQENVQESDDLSAALAMPFRLEESPP